MLFGLNLLELCELCAGAGYVVQLVATPKEFLEKTFEGTSGAPDAVAMTEFCGVFLATSYLVKTYALLYGPLQMKATLYLISALAWGTSGALAYKGWEMYKKPNAYVNVGMQAFFATVFGLAYLFG